MASTYVRVQHYVGTGFISPWGTKCPRPGWDGWESDKHMYRCECPVGGPKREPVLYDLEASAFPRTLTVPRDLGPLDVWEGE